MLQVFRKYDNCSAPSWLSRSAFWAFVHTGPASQTEPNHAHDSLQTPHVFMLIYQHSNQINTFKKKHFFPFFFSSVGLCWPLAAICQLISQYLFAAKLLGWSSCFQQRILSPGIQIISPLFSRWYKPLSLSNLQHSSAAEHPVVMKHLPFLLAIVL